MPGTWGVVVFVLAYKLCERAEQTFSLFQVDKGVPRATMALWSTVARTSSLLGSTYGGYVLYRKEARGLVVKFCWLRTITIAAQVFHSSPKCPLQMDTSELSVLAEML